MRYWFIILTMFTLIINTTSCQVNEQFCTNPNTSIESFSWYVADAINSHDYNLCKKYISSNTQASWEALFDVNDNFDMNSLSITKTLVEKGKTYTDHSGKIVNEEQWQKDYNQVFHEILSKTDYGKVTNRILSVQNDLLVSGADIEKSMEYTDYASKKTLEILKKPKSQMTDIYIINLTFKSHKLLKIYCEDVEGLYYLLDYEISGNK